MLIIVIQEVLNTVIPEFLNTVIPEFLNIVIPEFSCQESNQGTTIRLPIEKLGNDD